MERPHPDILKDVLEMAKGSTTAAVVLVCVVKMKPRAAPETMDDGVKI